MKLESLYRQPPPGMAVPRRMGFSHDGTAVTYLAFADSSNVLSLWRHELDGTGRTLLAGPAPDVAATSIEEDLRRERTRERARGITGYQRAEGAEAILALVSGRCLVSDGRSAAARLPGIENAQAAFLSPDGTRITFAREGDLFVAYVDGGQITRLTHHAEPAVFNGLPEFVASEELDRYEGMWWSADSGSVLFAHVDERVVPPFVIAHIGDEQLMAEQHHYPFAGGPNVSVELRLSSVASEAEPRPVAVPVDLEDGYLARVVPRPAGGWLVGRLARDQRSLTWYSVDDRGSVSELWIERCNPWIGLNGDAARVLADGHILRTTDRSGFRHLELHRPDGSLERQLTEGAWSVTALAHVDEQRGEVFFVGTADGVLERHLYAVPLDASHPEERPRRLSRERGWHEAAFSADGELWADTWSTVETPPHVMVRQRSGDPVLELHQSSAIVAEDELVVPALRTLPAADGSTPLQVAVFLPPKPAASRSGAPPAILWVYGGPHSQLVRDAWDLTVNPTRQALTHAGFAVVAADNRGTANRGLAFEAVLSGSLGDVEVADQAAVVEALAADGIIDRDRIGLTGASYGGFMTVMAMLRRPDLFRAGVAGAPVVDWDGYDTAYTERYLGTPSASPEAYAASSLLPRAADLDGDLLLIHGALDENVHLRHTGRLLAAFQAAERVANLVLLPNDRHSPKSAASALFIGRHTVRHLCQALAVPIPEDLFPRTGDPGDAHATTTGQAAS